MTLTEKENKFFCSRSCRGSADRKKKRLTVSCSFCENQFEKIKSQALRSKDHYCSDSCKKGHYAIKFRGSDNPNWKGKTREVICSCCKKSFVYEDYHRSKIKYCSRKCKAEHQKSILKGKSNPNYKSNKPDYLRVKERKYTGYKEWRIKVFERDNYNCKKCGTNSTTKNKLVAHHIINHHSYEAGRIDVKNGITLCSRCHWLFHKTYGTIHNNKEQLDQFLKNTNESA